MLGPSRRGKWSGSFWEYIGFKLEAIERSFGDVGIELTYQEEGPIRG